MADGAIVPAGGRGCGNRKPGAVYAECGLSPFGSPLEDFLFCPPKKLNGLVVPYQGIMIIRDPVNPNLSHVVDRLGVAFWPNVADWVEEVRRYGISSRIDGSGTDYKKLTPGSRIMPIHPCGWYHNFKQYADLWAKGLKPGHSAPSYDFCPKGLPEHTIKDLTEAMGPTPEMCIGVWWQSVTHGNPAEIDEEQLAWWKESAPDLAENIDRLMIRSMPSFEYPAFRSPDIVVPEFEPAFIGSWPITRLTVINDPVDGKHEKALEKVTNSSLPVELVEE